MKLAEALQIKKDLDIKLQNLNNRLSNNARIQEGQTSAENPKDLFLELDNIIKMIEEYVSRINLTNSTTLVDGEELSKLLSRRDAMKKKINSYDVFINEASQIADRYSKTEILVLPSYPVNELQKKRDQLAKEYRELDLKIQEKNWTTDLI